MNHIFYMLIADGLNCVLKLTDVSVYIGFE